MWLGDFPVGFTTVPILFTTHAADGSPVAPSTALEAADVVLYKDGSATQRTSTSGWTMTSPFDSVTGLHRLLIDLSDNTDSGFYAAGHVYTAVLTPDETVASLAVAKVIGQFGIDLASVLRPTTAGRTLDVSAGGEAGVDWANVGSPTTTVGLSGTTVKTATDVETDTQDIQARLPASLSSGNIKADVIAMSTSTTAADNIESAALTYTAARGLAGTALPNAAADAAGGLIISDAGGLDADAQLTTKINAILDDTGTSGVIVASLAADSITASVIAADAIGSSEIAASAANEIADALLDRDMSAGSDSGSTTVRTPRQALRGVRNKTAISGGTLTVYKEDDSTSSWTAVVTTATGDPIASIDPAGP